MHERAWLIAACLFGNGFHQVVSTEKPCEDAAGAFAVFGAALPSSCEGIAPILGDQFEEICAGTVDDVRVFLSAFGVKWNPPAVWMEFAYDVCPVTCSNFVRVPQCEQSWVPVCEDAEGAFAIFGADLPSSCKGIAPILGDQFTDICAGTVEDVAEFLLAFAVEWKAPDPAMQWAYDVCPETCSQFVEVPQCAPDDSLLPTPPKPPSQPPSSPRPPSPPPLPSPPPRPPYLPPAPPLHPAPVGFTETSSFVEIAIELEEAAVGEWVNVFIQPGQTLQPEPQKGALLPVVLDFQDRNLRIWSSGKGVTIDMRHEMKFLKMVNVSLELKNLHLENMYGVTPGGIQMTYGQIMMNSTSFKGCLGSTYASALLMTETHCVMGNCHISDCNPGPIAAARSTFIMGSGSSIVSCHSPNVGGGIDFRGNSLCELTEGSFIRNCTSKDQGGGISLVDGATATLAGGHVLDCSSFNGGGMYVNVGCAATLKDGSTISGCHADERGGGCRTSSSLLQILGGSRIERCTAVVQGGALALSGTLTMENSKIVDCSAQVAEGGAMSLADFVDIKLLLCEIKGCTAPLPGTILYAEAPFLFVATFCTFRQQGCGEIFAPFFNDVENSPIILREVVIDAQQGCDTPLSTVRSLTCDDGTYKNARGLTEGICADLGTCTDTSVGHAQDDQMTSVRCTCEAPTYTDPKFGDGWLSFGPYVAAGCLLAKRLEDVILVSEGLYTSLAKPYQPVELRNLTLRMTGTDKAPANWTLLNANMLPTWVELEQVSEPIPPDVDVVFIQVAVKATGLRERTAPYTTNLDIGVHSALRRVPISVYVASRTSSFVWGHLPNEASFCSDANTPVTQLEVDVQSTLPFTACDLEDLPVAHLLPTPTDGRRFSAFLTTPGLETQSIALEYTGDGAYEVFVRTEYHGLYYLRVHLDEADASAESILLNSYCPSSGRKNPLKHGVCGCDAGYFLDQGQCIPCGVGTSKSESGNQACAECAAGSFAPTPGAISCLLCSIGEFQALEGQGACERCDTRLSSSVGSTACDVCDSGFYRPSADTIPSSATCDYCVGEGEAVAGFACPWNTTLKTIKLERGFWRYSENTDDIRECKTSLSSNGLTLLSPCVGGSLGENCVPGQSGPKCIVCDEKLFTPNIDTGLCEECPPAMIPSISLVATVIGVIFFCWFLRWVMFKKGNSDSSLARFSASIKSVVFSVYSIGPSKIKMAAIFYQVVTGLKSTFNLEDFPDEVAGLIDLFSWIDLEWVDLAYPPGCLPGGFSDRLVLIAILPIALICFVPLVIGCVLLLKTVLTCRNNFEDTAWDQRVSSVQPPHWLSKHRISMYVSQSASRLRGGSAPPGQSTSCASRTSEESTSRASRTSEGPTSRSSSRPQSQGPSPPPSQPGGALSVRVKSILISILPLAILVVFFFLPNVSRSIFSTWICVPYENDDATGDKVFFMLKDPSTMCGSSEHNRLTVLSLALIILWPVGAPILFTFVLMANRKDYLVGKAHSPQARACRFLTGGYRNQCFYWELVEMTRRLAVSGWVVLIPYEYTWTRFIFVLGISVIILMFTAAKWPMRKEEDNWLSLAAQIALIFCFASCAIIKLQQAESLTSEQIEDLVGFTSETGPFYVLCFCAMAWLFAMLITYAYLLHQTMEKYFARTRKKPVSSRTSKRLLVGAIGSAVIAAIIGFAFNGLSGAVIGAAIATILGAMCGSIYSRILGYRKRWKAPTDKNAEAGGVQA